MNSGLKLTAGEVASVRAAVAATSFALPTTNVSKRYLGSKLGAFGLRSVGSGDHPHVADDGKHRLPGKSQPIAEVRAHPIGHELARHDEVQHATVGLERAELSGFQPAIERTRAKIATQAGADRFPSRFERRGHGRYGRFN
jgi:hypothetical protein